MAKRIGFGVLRLTNRRNITRGSDARRKPVFLECEGFPCVKGDPSLHCVPFKMRLNCGRSLEKILRQTKGVSGSLLSLGHGRKAIGRYEQEPARQVRAKQNSRGYGDGKGLPGEISYPHDEGVGALGQVPLRDIKNDVQLIRKGGRYPHFFRQVGNVILRSK